MTTKDNVTGLLTQDETAYVSLSTTRGAACANCRWFRPGAYEGHDACHLVDCYPLPILPTGWCNRHENIPTPEPAPDVVSAIEAVGEVIEEMMEGMMMNDSTMKGNMMNMMMKDGGMMEDMMKKMKENGMMNEESYQSCMKMMEDKGMMEGNMMEDGKMNKDSNNSGKTNDEHSLHH